MTVHGRHWSAKWIWGHEITPPRNVWRCFRRTFTLNYEPSDYLLHITADTSYELFVNGVFVGRGPARGYPFHYYYDTYLVGSLLFPDKPNSIAVLVNHLGNHTLSYVQGQAGLLCELVANLQAIEKPVLVSDASWQTLAHKGIHSRTPRISFQMEYEEQVDARHMADEWQANDYDDSEWKNALEIGAVGCSPWTTLVSRPISFLTHNSIQPQALMTLELARPRRGVIWSFDVQKQAQTNRYGMKSALPGERGWIIVSDIVVSEITEVRLHTWSNYEAIPIRINDVIWNGDPTQPIVLQAGRNFVMVNSAEFPAILFETNAPLTFSANRYGVEAEAWAFLGAFNELNGELEQAWRVADPLLLVGKVNAQAIVNEENVEDIALITSTQQFFAVEGGFCADAIATPSPRPYLAGKRQLIAQPEACLHTNAQATTLYPQPDGDLHLVIDFGRETIGYLTLDIEAEAGTIVDGNCFEGIDDLGIFWTNHLRNTFRYICRDGRQTFVSHRRRGFRYLSLTLRGATKPIHLHRVSVNVSTYPVQWRGTFRCSDPTLNTVRDVSAYTVQLCMLDTYTDCPAYEQVFWLGDARNSALVNHSVFGAYDLTRHCIELGALSLRDEMRSIVPPTIQRDLLTNSHAVSGWFMEIPMWTFLWMWTVWDYYWFTGDEEALKYQFEAVALCLLRCEALLSSRDLFAIDHAWNLVEWAAMDLDDDGEVTANTALLARSLDIGAKIATILGKHDLVSHYRELAQRLRNALHQHAWSDSHQGYVDTVRDETAYRDYQVRQASHGLESLSFEAFTAKQRISEATNTLMVLCDCVPKERYEATFKYVLAAEKGQYLGNDPSKAHLGSPDEIVPVGSPWFLFFTLETLVREGFDTTALNIIRDQWKRMLDKGATTFWETFPATSPDGKPVHWSRSLCHGWSAAPAYFLPKQILGITPLEAGFCRVRIQPQTFDLTWAEGSIPTIHGDISVRWWLNESGEMEVRYRVPEGIQVELVLPVTTDPQKGE